MAKEKKDKLIQFNRRNILDTAKTLFAQNGIEKTSMDDIAKAADCSKSTLYVYFKSKDDLYYSLVYSYMELLRDGIFHCLHQQEAIEPRYYSICELLTDFERKYPIYFDCILGKISVKETDFDALPVLREIYTVGEEINSAIVTFLERAIASGYADEKIVPLPTVFVLWSGICSLISTSSQKEEYFQERLGMNREEFLHYGFERLLHLIRRKH